ncbi:MAG: DUF1385 domain-containing protein [Fimbriimonadaceae bacterium]
MDALAQPVSHTLRPARVLNIDASCGAAAAAVRAAAGGMVPLTRDDVYVGVITEAGLRAALDANASLDDGIEPYVEQVLVIPPYASGADALRQFESSPNPRAVIVDDGGVVWGLLLPSDLFPKPPARFHPSMIGGMAAPYGVHLTAGIVSAGPGKWALVATGALMFAILVTSRVLAYGFDVLLVHYAVHQRTADAAANVLTLLLFALILRLSPLAGYHAAEHQVVHAIERGETLNRKTVSRMSRIHPRCGTNIATGVMLAAVIFNADLNLPAEIAILQPVAAVAVGLLFWRRAGSLVQFWVTTRPASPKQLDAGISAGEALLAAYANARNLRPSPWRSIWNAGMVQVGLGFMLVGFATAFFFNAIQRLDVLSFGLGIL